MPCKMGTRTRLKELQEIAAREITESNRKTKCACIAEAQESTRKRLESTVLGSHEDHIAEKGFNSINHFNLVARGVGPSGHAKNRRRRAREGPENACVRAPW